MTAPGIRFVTSSSPKRLPPPRPHYPGLHYPGFPIWTMFAFLSRCRANDVTPHDPNLRCAQPSAETAAVSSNLGQLQGEVPGMPDEASAGLEEPLLAFLACRTRL